MFAAAAYKRSMPAATHQFTSGESFSINMPAKVKSRVTWRNRDATYLARRWMPHRRKRIDPAAKAR